MSQTIAPPPTITDTPIRYRIPWLQRLPYPTRTMLRRWRGMLGMVIGVGRGERAELESRGFEHA